MKQLVAALALVLLLASGERLAVAHGMALFGHLSVDPQGELVVRIVDVNGALVEGQQVTAFAAAAGGRPTRAAALKEGPPGTYRGVVTAPGARSYQVTVDLTLAGDLHRLLYEVRAGEGRPEAMLPMAALDPPQGFPWSRLLYIGAAVVLAAATLVALMKKRAPAEGE